MAQHHQGDLRILKGFNARSLGLDFLPVVISASDLQLSYDDPSNIILTGNVAGQIITLGDATDRYGDGFEYRFHNGSNQEVTIRDYTQNVLGVVYPATTAIIYLYDRSTASGLWFWGRPSIGSVQAVVVPNFNCLSSASIRDLVVHSSSFDETVDVIDSNTIPQIPFGVFGMIFEKPTPTKCNVLLRGPIGGFTGLVRGSTLFVGTDGKPTSIAPLTGVVQRLGTAISATKIIYDPTSPYRRSP